MMRLATSRMASASALASAALALAACVSVPPIVPPDPDHARREVSRELGAVPKVAARVCVVRPSPVARTTTMEVRDNGRLIGATRGQTFACWLAAPGDHQITSIDDDTGPVLLSARAGQHYWILQEVMTLDDRLHAHLDFIDDATASEYVDACESRVMVNIPGYENRSDGIAVTPKL